MINYICKNCNKQFESDQVTGERECSCGSKDHAMMSLSEPSDFETIRADEDDNS
jgi:hypothetical protein